jgi:hypothetical protein
MLTDACGQTYQCGGCPDTYVCCAGEDLPRNTMCGKAAETPCQSAGQCCTGLCQAKQAGGTPVCCRRQGASCSDNQQCCGSLVCTDHVCSP